MRTVVLTGLLLVGALTSTVSGNSQHFAERHRHGRVYRDAVEAEEAHHRQLGLAPNTTKNWFNQLIDHNDPSLGTFPDKFYFDTTFWDKANGPCMMYLNGEGPLGSSVGGYMADIAKNLSACSLSIEHRWYGESLPAPLTDKALLTKTLTVDQAMADVVALMEHFAKNVVGKPDLTWMLVGGSYSGGMTVWMNEKYPGLFKASWAASGVVRSTFAYTDYDGHVKKVTSRDCGDALAFIMQAASDLYDSGADAQQRLRTMFNIPSYHTKTDIMWAFADVSASSVQYGGKTAMCNAILPVDVADPWGALAKYQAMMDDQWGSQFMASCYYSTKCMADKSMVAKWGPGGYSWVWECCNEMAWWQIGYPGSIRNRNVSVTYFIDQCRAAFYNNTAPDSWAFNDRHHGLHPVTQGYIVATQGSDDPWSTTGLYQSPGPNFPVNTAQCTNCGHCGAMMAPRDSDPSELVAQRDLVLSSLRLWLNRP